MEQYLLRRSYQLMQPFSVSQRLSVCSDDVLDYYATSCCDFIFYRCLSFLHNVYTKKLSNVETGIWSFCNWNDIGCRCSITQHCKMICCLKLPWKLKSILLKITSAPLVERLYHLFRVKMVLLQKLIVLWHYIRCNCTVVVGKKFYIQNTLNFLNCS